jgi:hypothetical protein
MVDFLRDVRHFIAIGASAPSAIRNQGRGVTRTCTDYLIEMDITGIPGMDEAGFHNWLDRGTTGLASRINVNYPPWGAARKAINLFLRDLLYNKYLSSEYHLEHVEPWMEIPLDSVVARVLRSESGGRQLPVWPGLKRLNAQIGARFQTFAAQLASSRNIARVQLDVSIWVNNR